jgi:hypothetical protein
MLRPNLPLSLPVKLWEATKRTDSINLNVVSTNLNVVSINLNVVSTNLNVVSPKEREMKMTDVSFPGDLDDTESEDFDEEYDEDEDEDEDTEDDTEDVENKEKRTRYSGPVLLDFEQAEEEIVDTTTLQLGRGRPAIDLAPYQQALASNFGRNVGRSPKEKIAWKSQINTPALTTIKSRFNSAGAKMDPPIGINWLNDVVLSEPVEGSDDPNEQGITQVSFVATKRIIGRGRKPKPSSDSNGMGSNAQALAAQSERLAR